MRGAFDPHVHVAPDFAPRRITDLELAERCLELGLAGFGLKSHYTATAERAAVVNAAVARRRSRSARSRSTTRSAGSTPPRSRSRRGRARGSCGCRRSAPPGEFAEVEHADPDGNVPVWVRFELELRAAGVRPRAGAGARRPTARRCPSCSTVLAVVARHGLVLATGHLSRDEIFAVVDAAVAAGRRDDRRHQPRVPVAQAQPRRAGGARRARRADAARVHDAVHRQVHVGRDLRRHARGGRAPARSGAPTSGRCSTRRSRTGWPSWPTASSRPASARRRSGSWPSRTRVAAGRCLGACR